jgi:membrane associated rhomboid family serine protease
VFPANSLIPIHDENPTRNFAILTAIIIALNVAVLLAEPSFGTVPADPQKASTAVTFLYRWGLVPWEITHGRPVHLAGCAGPCLPDKNVYLSLITSMFLHGGLLHIAGNMLFLWIFGNNIEDVLGKFRFVIFYLLAGLAAALAHVAANPSSMVPTVGASGAIAGVLGAYIVLFPTARVTSIVPIFFFLTRVDLPAIVVLGIWFASQFLIGAGSQPASGGGVAWMAHVGGFIAGIVLIVLFGGLQRRRRLQPG